MLKWREGQASPPFRVELLVTNNCNLRCRFCRGDWTPQKDDVLESSLKSIVNDAIEFGVEDFNICGGGEPFVKKDFVMSLIETIKKNGKRCFVNTNSTLLNEDDIRRLVELGLDDIAISTHGSDAETHDFHVNTPGAFDKLVNNIATIKRVKEELKKESPRVLIFHVLTKRNYEKIVELFRLAKELGVGSIVIFSMRVVVPEASTLKMDEADIKKFYEIVKNSREIIDGVPSNINDFTHEKFIKKSENVGDILISELGEKKDFNNAPCFEPWYNTAIMFDGRIAPCASLIEITPVRIGSGSLKEIRQGRFFSDIRDRILSHDVSDLCKICCIDKVFECNKIRSALTNAE